MRIINAYDGREYRPGEWFPAPGVGHLYLKEIHDHWLTATACVRAERDTGCHRIPLVVRFMHPQYPWERVAVIPT